ncbi:MAG: SIS domain-containing protein [Planctomycetes bacterium]|nr:SIS domain-containing protein [Planctomycetota bacterium]
MIAGPALIGELTRRHPHLASCVPGLERAAALVSACHRAGGQLLACGNGGSAADSDHLVGELVKGFRRPRTLADEQLQRLCALDPVRWGALAPKLQGGMRALSLCAHAALTTAIANDQDPRLVFAQQVHVHGRPGDVLVAFSTSGNSENVVCAAELARARGLTTIAFTGAGGGRLAATCDIVLSSPERDTAMVQEDHLPLYHALCGLVEDDLFA